MGMYDSFLEMLQCPICGLVSEEYIQTVIRDTPDMSYLQVGDSLLVDQDRANSAGYITLKVPQFGEDIYLLDIWDCPNGHGYNWAAIIIGEGIIKEIKAVPKTSEIINKTHFVSEECICGLVSDAGFNQIKDSDLLPDRKAALIGFLKITESDIKTLPKT